MTPDPDYISPGWTRPTYHAEELRREADEDSREGMCGHPECDSDTANGLCEVCQRAVCWRCEDRPDWCPEAGEEGR